MPQSDWPHSTSGSTVSNPGFIVTDLLTELSVRGDDWKDRLRTCVPLGRLADADDVASLVRFLLSPGA